MICIHINLYHFISSFLNKLSQQRRMLHSGDAPHRKNLLAACNDFGAPDVVPW